MNRECAALPIFREIMLRAYERRLVGPVPTFPREIEDRIDRYLVRQAALRSARDTARPGSFDDSLPAGPRPRTPAACGGRLVGRGLPRPARGPRRHVAPSR